jgi:hypothetical protein
LATTAVSVTLWPKFEGFALGLRLVVVGESSTICFTVPELVLNALSPA